MTRTRKNEPTHAKIEVADSEALKEIRANLLRNYLKKAWLRLGFERMKISARPISSSQIVPVKPSVNTSSSDCAPENEGTPLW